MATMRTETGHSETGRVADSLRTGVQQGDDIGDGIGTQERFGVPQGTADAGTASRERATGTGRGSHGAETFGIYDDDASGATGGSAGNARVFGSLESLPELFRALAADLSSMVSLKMALFKAEIGEAIKGYAKDGVFLAVAAVMGVMTLILLQVTLALAIAALMPFEGPAAFLVGFGAVTLLNAAVAGFFVWKAMKDLKNRKPLPERSIEEMRRDKEWLATETK